MILTHKGVFMMISDPLRDVFNALDPLGYFCGCRSTRDAFKGIYVSYLLRAFLSFLDVFLNFPLHL